MKPRVSVAMAAYNAEATIGDAIRSLQGQTLKTWQLSVVNDGSTDDTSSSLDLFDTADRRIWPMTRPHRCQTAAFNDALAACDAPYIAILDADDLYEPAKLKRQADFLDVHPEFDGVTTGSRIIGLDGQIELRPDTAFNYEVELGIVRGVDTAVYASLMVRGEVYERVGRLDERYACGADTPWVLRTLAMGVRWGHIPDLLYVYRRRPDSLSVLFQAEGERAWAEGCKEYKEAILCRYRR